MSDSVKSQYNCIFSEKDSVSGHKIGGVLQKNVPEKNTSAGYTGMQGLQAEKTSTYTLGSLLKISQEMMPMAAPLATPEKISTGK